MLLPGGMAIAAPVIMGLIDKGALAGMLTGALACGIMLGLQTANSGGAMDNEWYDVCRSRALPHLFTKMRDRWETARWALEARM